ncbi:hypothetical protein AgCh_017457 [Apium graveolens]
MALDVIYQVIPEDILLSITDKETTKEAWDAVKVLCQGAELVKKARVQILKSDFEAMSMKEGESLDDFCLKLSGLVTNIRVLGDEMAESYVVNKVLRAMPTRFLQITSAIEQFGDLETMSVEELVGSLKAHDERLGGKNESTKGTGQLLLTEEEWRKRDKEERKLLLTREEWIQRSSKVRGSGQKFLVKEPYHGGHANPRVDVSIILGMAIMLLNAKGQNVIRINGRR